jgi:hypothetical protein
MSYDNCVTNGNPIYSKKIGDVNNYTSVEEARIKVGTGSAGIYGEYGMNTFALNRTPTTTPFAMKSGLLSNVNATLQNIPEFDSAGKGLYLVMLNSEMTDAPCALIIVGQPGGFGQNSTTIHSTVGIGNYASMSLACSINNNALQVSASGSTGSATSIPSVRYTVLALNSTLNLNM